MLSLYNKIGTSRLLGLIMLAGFILLRSIDPAPLEYLRLKTFDFYQEFKPREVNPNALPVVIIDLDEKSLKEYGQWPWPRTLVAKLTEKVMNARAASIGYDILFSEPDRMSPANLVPTLSDLPADLRAKLSALPSNDDILARTIKKYQRVILGQSGSLDPARAGKLPRKANIATKGGDPADHVPNFPGVIRNLPELEAAAQGIGMITVLPDLDGVIRRVPTLFRVSGEYAPSFAIEILRVATGQKTLLAASDELGMTQLIMPAQKITVPTFSDGRLWVYFSEHSKARYVSAADVLSDLVPPARLAGRLAIVGTSSLGLLDVKVTPVEAAMPGVEVHAQIIEAIMTGALLQRPTYLLGAEILLAAVTAVLLILLIPMLGALPAFALQTVIAVGFTGLSWYLFSTEKFLLDVTFPFLACYSIFLAMTFFNYIREERQKQQIRGAFGQYLSPALVEQLAEDPSKLNLGGETRELSILFTDVRGFTSISETYKSDPQGLTVLINSFLTPLSNEIMNRKGTIDKYMGDNIMAFWNAPVDVHDHAKNACGSALAMMQALEKLNERRLHEDKEAGREHKPLAVGIGINTGECVVGNMGSDQRFDYSVLGDSVNFAARLEGQTKSYGVTTLIGEQTALGAMDEFAILEIDLIRVKGKEEPERLFTLLGNEDLKKTSDFQKLQDSFLSFTNCYRAQKWDEAKLHLQTCAATQGIPDLASLVTVFEDRIKTYQIDPPRDNWDGVFTATSK